MTQEAQTLMMVRGLIASLPKEEQEKVAKCAGELRAVAEKYEPLGMVAVALVGAEAAAEI